MKWFLLAYLILSIFLFDPKLFKGGDNVQYMLLAESLATGQGYRDIFLVDSPKHWVWPPGFPALLVPVFWIFGRSAVAMKVLVMLIGLAGYYFYCKLAQFALTPPADRWAMTLYLTVPILIVYNHWVLADIPFQACVMGVLYALRNE